MLKGNLEKYKKSELIAEIEELRMEVERLKGHNVRGAGRKKKDLNGAELQMVRMRNLSGESLESIAKSMGICRSTLYRLLKDDVN